MAEKGVAFRTFQNVFFVVVGRSLGFFIPFIIAAVYGTDQQTDAFFFAFTLILMWMMTLGSVVETVIVPYVSDMRAQGRNVRRFTLQVILRLFAGLAAFSVVLVLGLKPLLGAVTQFSPETIELLFLLSLELLPCLFFSIATDTVNGVLNANRYFKIAAISPAIRSIFVICGILALKPSLGIHGIALAYAAGESLRFAFSFFFFSRTAPHEKLEAASGTLNSFFKYAFFQAGALFLMNGISLVDQSMASWFGPGSVTLYTYAERMRNVLFLVFAAGAGPVVLSEWSRRASENQDGIEWKTVLKTFQGFFVFAAVLALILAVCRMQLATLVLGHGEFPKDQIRPVADIFGILLAGVPFQIIHMLAARFLVIYRKNAFYFAAGAVMIALNVALNFFFMTFFRLHGIAVGTTVLELIFSILLFGKIRSVINRREK
jgi:putative peptidoglycan lipid II flippase